MSNKLILSKSQCQRESSSPWPTLLPNLTAHCTYREGRRMTAFVLTLFAPSSLAADMLNKGRRGQAFLYFYPRPLFLHCSLSPTLTPNCTNCITLSLHFSLVSLRFVSAEHVIRLRSKRHRWKVLSFLEQIRDVHD